MVTQTKAELEALVLELNQSITRYRSLVNTQDHIISTYNDLQELHDQTVNNALVRGYVIGGILTATIALVIAFICTL